ncbi:MAG: DUF2232 domain-containing protein, partial [Deltaproteobacteria bacterium]|nr:DUF2232 domain-containing protein [Deltaproteobacteria bacterium]
MSQGRKTFSGQFYLLSIIGTALFFTVSSLPNGFIWLYFITPLPVIYYITVLGLDRGLKIIAYAAIIAGIVALATGESETLISAFSLVPTGAALAMSIKRREQVFRSGLKAFVALGLTWVMLGIVFSAVNHQNMYSGMLQNIDAGLVNAFDSYSKAPDFPAKSKPELRAVFTRMRHMVPKVFPGALVISAVFTIWLNMLL